MLTDVILPCLDEAAALPWVLERMPPGYRADRRRQRLDDGSAEVAARHGRAGRDRARSAASAPPASPGCSPRPASSSASWTATGRWIPPTCRWSPARSRGGAADLVLGARRPSARGAWPLHARLANRALADAVRRRTGVALHDLGPMRAARRAALLELGIADRRFGWPLEMVVRAAEAGWRIAEVDVPYRPRTGRSKVTGTVGGTLRTVRDMRRVLAA